MREGPRVPCDLGDGLVLRRAVPQDCDRLVAFNAEVHGSGAPGTPDEGIASWTHDLLCRPHPTTGPGDFTVVEDTARGAIVSCANLISQTWSYGGVAVPVGRPEFVGTHPDYRRRGLIRRQFDVIHAWSAGRGHIMQAITGIPWFYRQFGYEPVLDLGTGRLLRMDGRAPAPGGPYRLRPAGEDDLGTIAAAAAHGSRRYLLACLRDEAMWRYELDGRSPANVNHVRLQVIEDGAGAPAGFVAHSPRSAGGTLWLRACELLPGTGWPAVATSLVGLPADAGRQQAAGGEQCRGLVLGLGDDHPLYHLVDGLQPQPRARSAWYARVEDLPRFLVHVAPVLAQRLAASALAGYEGNVRLSFYRAGLRLAFAQGRLESAEPWPPDCGEPAMAAFPERTFLRLLFGHRTMDELQHAFSDCWVAGREAQTLLDTLFPKLPSFVWQVA